MSVIMSVVGDWRMWALIAVMVAVAALNLVLPSDVVVLAFLWVPVVASAAFAGPRGTAILAMSRERNPRAHRWRPRPDRSGTQVLTCIREEDTLARLGGDEFVIACPSIADAAEVDVLCSRLIHSLDEPIVLDMQRVDVGATKPPPGLGVGDGAGEVPEEGILLRSMQMSTLLTVFALLGGAVGPVVCHLDHHAGVLDGLVRAPHPISGWKAWRLPV